MGYRKIFLFRTNVTNTKNTFDKYENIYLTNMKIFLGMVCDGGGKGADWRECNARSTPQPRSGPRASSKCLWCYYIMFMVLSLVI